MSGTDSSDRIFLSQIQVFAYGGVSAEERAVGQHYSVDVSVTLDLERAAAIDDLGETVSYVVLHDVVVEIMRSSPFRLIESRARLIACTILERTSAASVTVTLRKIAPPIDGILDHAGVEITLSRAAASG
jgi:dihydroneopterin aldolase